MTIKELKRLHALNKEIEYEKSHLRSLCKKAGSIDKIGGESVQIADILGDIEVLKNQICIHLKECVVLYKEILDFINSIPDALLRLAISLKYINGLEWEQVALHIGGGNTADAIRKSCERFLKQYLKNSTNDN